MMSRQLRAGLCSALFVAALSIAVRAQGQVPNASAMDGNFEEPKVTVRFFGDVNVARADEGKTSFALGQLDLFATARVAERWQFLAETLAEATAENEIAVEVERLLIQFLAPGGVRVAMGRFHTAIGYYNNAYHHGLWFQTAATRPKMFAFEDLGGLLPVHQVGLTADGPIPVAGAGLRWIAEIGNGHGPLSGAAVQTAYDHDRQKAVNLAVVSRPHRHPGLQMGVSYFIDRFAATPTLSTRESILTAHVAYVEAPYEWLSEFARIRHTSTPGGATVADSWYVQAGRQVGLVTPFVRYESIDTDSRDVLLADVGRPRGPTIGVRVDVSPSVALKCQYDYRRDDRRSDRSLIGQVAFAF